MLQGVKVFVVPLFPLGLSLIILLIGLICLWFPKSLQVGKVMGTVGVFLLCIMSFPFVPDALLFELEHKYDSVIAECPETSDAIPPKYVVVLAGGHVLDPELPISSQFSDAGLVRLIEGIRLYNLCQKPKLVLSGGGGKDSVSDAELMAELSLGLGVEKDDIVLEGESISTFDEAIRIKPIVNDDPFVLVTSASHMPRAVEVFMKLGMDPLPAPTGHLVKHHANSVSVLPSHGNLLKSRVLMYEYLALMKERLR